MTKRAFRPTRKAQDSARYPTSEARTDRRAFLGRLGLILAGGAAVMLGSGCSSRAVGDDEIKKDTQPWYPDSSGGVADAYPAPLDAGPIEADGEPEPDGEPGYGDLGGTPDSMPAPLDLGSAD